MADHVNKEGTCMIQSWNGSLKVLHNSR